MNLDSNSNGLRDEDNSIDVDGCANNDSEECHVNTSNNSGNNNNTDKEYFETDIPNEAKFQLNADDWTKLKSYQKDHRFMKGEWEDYFVIGMKESNKYCVFAFKDHYVNQASIRAREARMTDGAGGSSSTSKDKTKSTSTVKNKKIFSAQGYCVFQDCQVRFFLKMSPDRVVHVYYEGKLRHCCNEVRARYFRGKSRRELGDVLKNSTPLQEFKKKTKHRAKNGGNFEAGNADYIGKTLSVYRRISAEAKDSYQTLLSLRKHFIEKSAIHFNKLKLKVDYQSKLFDKTYVKGTTSVKKANYNTKMFNICYLKDSFRLFSTCQVQSYASSTSKFASITTYS
jgi:hypothetical protein